MNAKFRLALRRLELKSKIKSIIILVFCCVSLYLFSSVILGKFLPLVLIAIFFASVYYFLIKNRGKDSFGILLVMLGLFLMVVSAMFVNSILFGVESYVGAKYKLEEKGQNIYCIHESPVWLIIKKCVVPDNQKAEKEANLINNLTNWSFETLALLGLVLLITEEVKKKNLKAKTS